MRARLFQEILRTLRQWPELEQNIFARAHYHGQSIEVISRSLQMNAEDVDRILGRCDRRLHASLRNLTKKGLDASSLPIVGTARPAA